MKSENMKQRKLYGVPMIPFGLLAGFAARYSHYIRLKMEEDDSGLAETMTGYPAEKDEIFAESLEQQRKEWFQDVPIDKLAKASAHGGRVRAFCAGRSGRIFLWICAL